MRSIPLPSHLVEDARAFASGEREPAEPRDAATVVLLGEGPSVYLLKRQASMAFAAGMAVFPGGGVDPRDFHDVPWAGPSPAEWAARLGTSEDEARALVCAAVRETFEESGVLLAGPSADTVVEDTTSASYEEDREALVSRELAFSDFLTRRGLVLRSDLLGPWSGWLTPVFEPRRYRTWFFVAVLPAGQRTRDVSSESSSVTWLPASSAVSMVESGELVMLPPTYLTCLEIAELASPAAVLDAARDRTVSMFMPEVVEEGEGFVLSRPEWIEGVLERRFG